MSCDLPPRIERKTQFSNVSHSCSHPIGQQASRKNPVPGAISRSRLTSTRHENPSTVRAIPEIKSRTSPVGSRSSHQRTPMFLLGLTQPSSPTRRRTKTIAEKKPLPVTHANVLVDSIGPHGWAKRFLRSLNDVSIEFRLNHVVLSAMCLSRRVPALLHGTQHFMARLLPEHLYHLIIC